MGLSQIKKREPVYWETKDGKKINVDDMTEEHAKNALKCMLIAKKRQDFFDERSTGLYYEFLAEDYGDR